MSTVVAISGTAQLASLAQVDEQCASIEAWAASCDSVGELKEQTNRLKAIDTYLTETSTEGRNRVAAALRRLEVRIGQLLGPAMPTAGPGRGKASVANDGLTRDQRHDFRNMAEHADLIDALAEESTDDDPVSRAKVLRGIEAEKNIAELGDGELTAIDSTLGPDATIDDRAKAINEAVRSRNIPTKPDLGGGISHPARYTDALIPVFRDILDRSHPTGGRILDPFAGTGKIHLLADDLHKTVGVEIEPEWAGMHPDTIVGDALALPFDDGVFDAIVTSPTYGNRLADHHNATDPETRRSYKHDLGRDLAETNSGAMHWGPEYRDFHEQAWAEAVRVLGPCGVFILNIKDHIRAGEWQDVTAWHVDTLLDLGLRIAQARPVTAPSMRAGANNTHRVGAEMVIGFDRGGAR